MKQKIYSFNEPMSSLTHLIGAVFSSAALVILIVYAAIYGTAWHVVSFSIFGASLVLLYTSSALFHFFSVFSKAKTVFQRIDHSMIYVLIAATYTPICLTVLRGLWGWSIFGIVWGFATLGITLKSCGIGFGSTVSAVLYILMGWLMMIAIYPLLKVISLAGFFWILAGGIFYTVGVLFFGLEKIFPRKTRWSFGMHEVFHLFVIAGSAAHVWFVMNYLI